MKNKEFEKILKTSIDKIQSTLGAKADEYAMNGDRLYNFKIASRMNGNTPQEALWGMAMKHLVSVKDLVTGQLKNTEHMVDEKCIDLINYLILLIAVLAEDRK